MKLKYPHFTDRIVPGWFDKTLPWRRGDGTRLQDVLLETGRLLDVIQPL